MPDVAADSILRDAASVVGKDLRLEWRSRCHVSQLLPFALLVLILFAFALDPDRRILEQATPGLFWLAVLFSMLLAIQRAFAVETTDGIIDALRLSDLDPAGIFLGKAAGIGLHLLVLEVALAVGVTVLDGTTPLGAPAGGHHVGRHRGPGRRWRPLRHLGGWPARSRHAAAHPHAPGGGPRAHRGHRSVRRRLRPGLWRGLALVRPAHRFPPSFTWQ